MEAQQMLGFETPSKRDYQSVRNWFWNEKPVVQKEQRWILMKEDLLAIRPEREPDFFERTIERVARRFDCRLVRVLSAPIIL
jgi:hypothetical protein